MNKLKYYRKLRGMTQAELAVAAKTQQVNVSKFEADNRSLATAQAITVLRFSRALGVTVEDLIADNDDIQ